MLNIAIIVGSTRPGRNSLAVAQWVTGIAQRRTDARFELVDIKDQNLPLLDEPIPPSMGQYSQPHTKAWAAKIASFDASQLPVRIAGEVKGFDARQYMDHKEARRMGRFAQFAVACSVMALADAGLTVTDENAERVGVMINTGGGGMMECYQEALVMQGRGPKRVSPLHVPLMAPNMAACQPSIVLGIRGPVCRTHQLGHIAEAGGNVGMIGTKHLFVDRQCAPQERLSLVPDCGFSQTARWATTAKLRALVAGRDLVAGRASVPTPTS